MIILTEIISIHRFQSSDRLASYIGLVPGERSSGETKQQTGISVRRNAHLRRVLVESAWIAIEHDPVLLAKFTQLSKRMRKTAAIIVIARKLVNRIMAVLVHDEPYKAGVVARHRAKEGRG